MSLIDIHAKMRNKISFPVSNSVCFIKMDFIFHIFVHLTQTTSHDFSFQNSENFILLMIILEPKKVRRHCFKRSKKIKTKNQLNDVVTFEIGMMVKLLKFNETCTHLLLISFFFKKYFFLSALFFVITLI
jgi:hypothetical protein